MTKSELVSRVAESTGMTKTAVEKAYNAIFEAMAADLADGGQVAVPGFGTFEVKEQAARTGRNPRTGEEILIAASKRVAFKMGKALKEAVNG